MLRLTRFLDKVKSPSVLREEERRAKLRRKPWKTGEKKPNIFTKGGPHAGPARQFVNYQSQYGDTETLKKELVTDETAFQYRKEGAKHDYVDFYQERAIGFKHKKFKDNMIRNNRISDGNLRRLYHKEVLPMIQPSNPMDEQELYVDGAKWVEIPNESRYKGVKSNAVGRRILKGNEAHMIVVGGGLTGQAMMYAHQWAADEYGAASSTLYTLPESKKGGIKSDLIQTYAKSSRAAVGRAHNILIERDPNFTEAHTAFELGTHRMGYTNPTMVKLALESKDFIRKLKFHLSVLGEDAPDVHFEPVGSLWIARKSDSNDKKAKLVNAYNVARTEHYKYNEMGKFTAMLLGPERLKSMFPWMNTDDIELAVYGLEHEGTYNYQALHRYLLHKNRQLGNKYYTGELVGVRKVHAKDAYHTANLERRIAQTRYQDPQFSSGYRVGDDVQGMDYEFGPNSAVKSAFFKLPNQKDPVEINFYNMVLCTGRWTGEACSRLGIGDPEAENEYLRRAIPIVGRKRYTYIINAKNAGPVLDMPYIIDEDSKLTVRRHGLKGDYIVTLWPQKDKGDVEPDDYNLEADHKFFWDRVYPELKHRMPLLSKENMEYKGGWGRMIDYNKFDGAPLIGPHPYHRNISICSGFGGLSPSMRLGAAMWLGNYLWKESEKNFRQIIGPGEFDWRKHCGVDRIIEFNRTYSEKSSV